MNAEKMMLEQDLIATTRHMRELQKAYFRTRDKNILSDCKAAEKKVDDLLKQLAPAPVASASPSDRTLSDEGLF